VKTAKRKNCFRGHGKGKRDGNVPAKNGSNTSLMWIAAFMSLPLSSLDLGHAGLKHWVSRSSLPKGARPMDCRRGWHSQHVLDVLNSSTRMTGRVAVGGRRMMDRKTGVHSSPLRARLPWELHLPPPPRATTDPGGARSSADALVPNVLAPCIVGAPSHAIGQTIHLGNVGRCRGKRQNGPHPPGLRWGGGCQGPVSSGPCWTPAA
jgi:hypothetical protein